MWYRLSQTVGDEPSGERKERVDLGDWKLAPLLSMSSEGLHGGVTFQQRNMENEGKRIYFGGKSVFGIRESFLR